MTNPTESPRKVRYIEVMDTTLRDGEQTSGVAYSPSEKLTIAQLLLNELKADRIEVASARVSEGELIAVKNIIDWAKLNGHLHKIEVLTFVDGRTSVDWMLSTGARTMNLLTKGSINHLTHQLKKKPEEHFREIAAVLAKAKANGIACNIYLEDWSNGMKTSREYVSEMVSFLLAEPVERIMLPDTLGILSPSETFAFVSELVQRFPTAHFDFHAHNDYDLATANVLEAVKAGAAGIHLTINGMGERAGNAPMASTVAAINDLLPGTTTRINEQALYAASKLVESFSGMRVPANKPIVGENVFTQTAGIHADGDKKNKLYHNDLMPERFGRQRSYALGKTSGKANIENNLQELGIQLNGEDLKKVTQRIIELGDRKETVTQADLPYILSDILDTKPKDPKAHFESYVLAHAKDLRPSATLRINIKGQQYEEHAQGDGQYDAFMNALKKVYAQLGKELPVLTDYEVRIPPGGKTDALCETIITWHFNNKEFKTRGLDSDQTVAAIKATEKMLNTF